MEHPQHYVSDELSHFVGGQGRSDEECYDTLVNKILKSGWLTYSPHDPTRPRTATLDLSKPISTDEIIGYQVVCFCDIPESYLKIHTSKYGRFGLSFKKALLIDQGACPVHYVAKEGPVPANFGIFKPGDFAKRIDEAKARGWVDRALYFDSSARALFDIFAALDALCCDENDRYFKGVPAADFEDRLRILFGLTPQQVDAIETALKGNAQARNSLRICNDFLMNHIFTFMKCFDAKRTVDDAANYYMEREWRVGANINFNLGDVVRVFLPPEYMERFRADLPTFTGQISLLA